jgi:hypothetical protein
MDFESKIALVLKAFQTDKGWDNLAVSILIAKNEIHFKYAKKECVRILTEIEKRGCYKPGIWFSSLLEKLDDKLLTNQKLMDIV